MSPRGRSGRQGTSWHSKLGVRWNPNAERRIVLARRRKKDQQKRKDNA